MDILHRRKEILRILTAGRRVRMRELAEEFHVSRRTIYNDILYLSAEYPIRTRQGENGGIFLMDSYRPYADTLTKKELELLQILHDGADGGEKEILSGIIRKYGHKIE